MLVKTFSKTNISKENLWRRCVNVRAGGGQVPTLAEFGLMLAALLDCDLTVTWPLISVMSWLLLG